MDAMTKASQDKFNLEAENKANSPQQMLGSTLAFLVRRENLVGDAGDISALVVQILDDLELAFSDFRERSSGGERDYALPEVHRRCGPISFQCFSQVDSTATEKGLSSVCTHDQDYTACWN